MTELFLEAVRGSILPCSIVLWLPAIINVLIAQRRLASLAAYIGAATVVVWLRVGGIAIPVPWLTITAGVVVIAAGVVQSNHDEARGLLFGSVFALFWIPCVGPALGSMLGSAGLDGPTLIQTVVFIVGTTMLVWVVALAPTLTPSRFLEPGRFWDRVRLIARILTVPLGLAVSVGWYEEIVGVLVRLSL